MSVGFDAVWEPLEDLYTAWLEDGEPYGEQPELAWVSDGTIESRVRRKLVEVQRDYKTPCWEWTGVLVDGYGQVSIGGTRHLVHRLVYAFFHGGVPAGLVVDHLCRNRPCQNPAHHEAVISKENTLRGDGPAGQNARKQFCPAGHEYTPENTFHRRDGRHCRACQDERNTRRRSRSLHGQS